VNLDTEKVLIGYMAKKKIIGLITAFITFWWGAVCILNSYLIGNTVDAIFLAFDDPSRTIISISILIISLSVGWILTILSIYYMGVYGTKVSQILRRDVFIALQDQSAKFYDDNNTGDLISKATNDIDVVRRFFMNSILLGPILVAEFIFCIGFLIYIDIPLAILLIFSIPVNLLLSYFAKKNYGPIFALSRKQLGLVTKVITENVESATLVRTFNASEVDIQRFDKENTDYRDTTLRAKKISARIQPVANYLATLTFVLVLGFGGLRVMEGHLTVGMLISAAFLTSWLAVPVRHVTNLMVMSSEARGAGDRILEILNSVPDIQDDPQAINFPGEIKGDICFENVSFGYQNEPVLENLDFTIPAGNTIALLGATGCGKSSLINLVPRYYDPNEGTLYIDGINIKSLKLQSLRKNIGFVDQESFLFARSIRDNIAFGKPDATDNDILDVARLACIHDFIMTLPDGYNTVVGERGLTLSGGQRQRLSIARTLLANPKIVIFDDSLSAVDVGTEREIQQALDNLLKQHTTIIVTQRLSLTQNADFCIVLKKGRIIELGSHQELLKLNGLYSELFKTQVDDIMDLTVLLEVVT
ncbi:MAG: ABC transporter ATP-binding protein, partial [Candidatus Hodarchaeales archaeon]